MGVSANPVSRPLRSVLPDSRAAATLHTTLDAVRTAISTSPSSTPAPNWLQSSNEAM